MLSADGQWIAKLLGAALGAQALVAWVIRKDPHPGIVIALAGYQLVASTVDWVMWVTMADAGIFHEDDRVELIDGEIVEMAAIGSRHAGGVNRVSSFFSGALGNRAIISVQNPVRLGRYSEPQPDVVLLRPRPDFYGDSHPGPDDVFLIVEVADSSIDYDRGVKVPLYAQSGIQELWLVDLEQERVEVYREPKKEGYRVVRHFARGDSLSPQAFPDASLTVDGVLG